MAKLRTKQQERIIRYRDAIKGTTEALFGMLNLPAQKQTEVQDKFLTVVKWTYRLGFEVGKKVGRENYINGID